MRRHLTLFLLLLLSGGIAVAQSKVITGTVTDDDGAPVPCSTVIELGTRNATTSILMIKVIPKQRTMILHCHA